MLALIALAHSLSCKHGITDVIAAPIIILREGENKVLPASRISFFFLQQRHFFCIRTGCCMISMLPLMDYLMNMLILMIEVTPVKHRDTIVDKQRHKLN